VECKV